MSDRQSLIQTRRAARERAYAQLTPEEKVSVDRLRFMIVAMGMNVGPHTSLEIAAAIGELMAQREEIA